MCLLIPEENQDQILKSIFSAIQESPNKKYLRLVLNWYPRCALFLSESEILKQDYYFQQQVLLRCNSEV